MSDTVTTNATCSQGYHWMFNSLGQSPCVVTSHLFTSCGDGCIENIDNCVIPAALSPGTNYTNQDDVGVGFAFEYGACPCSTVWYSTLSACAVCQGRGLAIDPWIVYSAQCKPLYIQKFSDTIPNGTAVPGWAFLPIANDEFDLKTAQALAALHPAENQAPTVIPGQLSSTTLPTTASALPTSTHSGTPTSTSSSSPVVSKKNLAGIIAGSVVGGGVFLVGLAVFVFCCVKRRRRALYADNLVARHDLLLLPDPSDAASPASRSGPAPLVPSQQPKSATVARSFGTHSGSTSNHTVLADVAGFPAPRSPAAATSAINPASSPMTSSSAAALASWSSQSSLIGRVRSGGAAGASHSGLEQEADSGWREGRPSVTLPPPYTPD